MTTIRDILDLPDAVRKGDFVLRLSEGVERPDETLNDYVVTPQLTQCFDDSLSLIKSALAARSSKACYLHGSFGCGKSHFMAVLNLILQGNTRARAIPELAEIIVKHNDWIEGKKFFQVPFHMIGQPDMETAILGGYADHVHRLHPEAPPPSIYRSEAIFADAVALRKTMGDDKFFEKLNAGEASGGGEWGDFDQGWAAETFDQARSARQNSDERNRLVADLVQHFFTQAQYTSDYIDLDTGLSVISKHAKSLGYDAVILFLDELILWLASRSADPNFVSQEGQKLAKLVEAQKADRPVPLVSFIARQRDLRELVGDKVTGAEYTAFADVLDWWEGRFSTIKLEDRNLPAIAEKRVLKPKDEAAKVAIDEAFKKATQTREDVMRVLLTSNADRELFRKIYPFSPAFMHMLVEMSFLLQRDRTALKVMLQLLIDQQDRLELGSIVPVGDLFDYIAQGDEVVSDDVRRNFDNAKKLYEEKLRPMLENEHGLSLEDPRKLDPSKPAERQLMNDDRLIKTLLLAALAPNLESFRGLTASRLAALNHGTIRSPIPGRESSMVIQKCRKWAAEVGQIKIGEEPTNPSIAIQLTGVDTDGIIEAARTYDNDGNRLRLIKELIFAEMRIKPGDEFTLRHPFPWRATARVCEVLFADVFGLPLSSFDANEDSWKVIIDWPFDKEGRGPNDDKAKIDEYRAANPDGTKTIVWLPSFLGKNALQDLGNLVILDFLLKGENLNSYVYHLNPTDQHTARTLLENRRTELKRQLVFTLETAYGISNNSEEKLDPLHSLDQDEHLYNLETGCEVRLPAAAKLDQAFHGILDQALRNQFPGHPAFDEDAKLNSNATLGRVLLNIQRAVQENDRTLVEQSERKEMRQIAVPLNLGEMGDSHFVLRQHWLQHFNRKVDQGSPLLVRNMRKWIDEPTPMGLPKKLQDLIILAYAAQSNRSGFIHGSSVELQLGSIIDDVELRTVDLPTAEQWERTLERAGSVFGLTGSKLVNAANVTKLSSDIQAAAATHLDDCRAYAKALQRIGSICDSSSARVSTAVTTEKYLSDLSRCSTDKGVALAVAERSAEPPDAALGVVVKKSPDLASSLRTADFGFVELLEKLDQRGNHKANEILVRLREAAGADEHVIGLASTIDRCRQEAHSLISEAVEGPGGAQPQPEPEPEPKPEEPSLAKGSASATAEDLDSVIDEMRSALSSNEGAKIEISWRIVKDEE